MGIGAVFRGAAQTAFGIFADVAVSARYESVVTAVYDASAGVTSTVTTSGFVSVIFDVFSRSLVDGDRIKPEDIKALVLPNGLPAVPKVDDRVYTSATVSSIYRVMNSEVDPATALYTMQLRREG